MDVQFVRHGITELNQAGVYCGARLDPPLSGDGVRELRQLVARHPYPPVEMVFCSPAQRCRMTAAIVYPGHTPLVIDLLRELDFGDWEGQPARQVQQLPQWQQRAVQGEDFAMPGGESYRQVALRMRQAMDQILPRAAGCASIGVVTHSVAIMRLFAHTLTPALPAGDAFCPNGMGYLTRVDPQQWESKRQLCYQGMLPQGAPRPDMSTSPYISK